MNKEQYKTYLRQRLYENNENPLKLRTDGHYDGHQITQAHLDWLGQQPEVVAATGPVTLTMPDHLPTLPNALIGPASGDLPVSNDHPKVYNGNRGGGRSHDSKMMPRNLRQTNAITAITRPDKETGKPFLITAFGGVLAPQEPGDPNLRPENKEASIKFWAEHALADGRG